LAGSKIWRQQNLAAAKFGGNKIWRQQCWPKFDKQFLPSSVPEKVTPYFDYIFLFLSLHTPTKFNFFFIIHKSCQSHHAWSRAVEENVFFHENESKSGKTRLTRLTDQVSR
jgi:hypothetical protein